MSMGPVLNFQFVPVPLARVGDEAAHLGVVLRAVGHQRQLVGCMEFDQTAGVASLSSISVQR